MDLSKPGVGRVLKSQKSASSSGSDSSSTSEEERLRRLFNSCDGDGDGYLDGNDFVFMCRELNMEESAFDIMQQLGMGESSQISFQDFIRYRGQVMVEAENLQYIEDAGIGSDTSGLAKAQNNVTSWPTMSSDSLGAHSGKPDSLDYDSGARDLSPEPASLQKLMECHAPKTLRQVQESSSEAPDFLELANRLHLAALTSLKGEIIELTNRLQHVTNERDLLEKQLTKSQVDKLRIQREYEDRLEQTALRYEERVTELHSVIAELRKKIERHHINVIREEDEYEESDAAQSNKSQDGGSVNENHANESQSASLDIGHDLNVELSRVVTELESAIDERKRIAATVETGSDTFGADDDSVEEKALEVCKHMERFELEPPPPPPPPRALRPATFYPPPPPPPNEILDTDDLGGLRTTFHPPPPPPPNEFPDPGYLQEEINSLRAENSVLQEQIGRQESELNKFRAALGSVQEERDKFKKKIRELQSRVQGFDGSTSPHNSRTSTPTKSAQINTGTAERGGSGSDQFPVAKIAELKKLKTCFSDRQVLGAEISSQGVPNTKVAEHLVQSLQECSNMQEIVQTLYKCGSDMSDSKVREFEIEFERLQSKIDNLKSQNDLVNLTLEESKAQSDHLSVLIGKYESNLTALQLVLNYSDQTVEAYEVLCALMESEQGVLLANCRAAGLGSLAGDESEGEDQEEIASILQRAHHSRKTAETMAKHLLHKFDRSCGVHMTGSSPNPWEDLSSNSRTASTTSSTASSADMEFGKNDEQRLREYIQQLKGDRTSVKMTVMELESVHIDPLVTEPRKTPEAQRLDLENAVLMQELMAMKEEKSELKSQNYLIEKEKRALELRLSGKESQEQAYLVQIDHLKSEVSEQEEKSTKDSKDEDGDTSTPSITLAELRSHNASEIAQDLAESLKREKKLKSRVQELVVTLEKLSRNSEIRHQQSAEFVNDLKRANSALISAFDKAKKKYQSKLKKLETQMQGMTERYETQIRMMKQRISILEDEKRRPANETSL